MMNKKAILLKRFRSLPRDFTFDELEALFGQCGFELSNKGTTSGSRVEFINTKDNKSYIMHKPHPANIVKGYAVLKYKGYTGIVEYSEEDICFFGKVQGLAKDCITYEGNNEDELRHDFEEASALFLAEVRRRFSSVYATFSAIILGCLRKIVYLCAVFVLLIIMTNRSSTSDYPDKAEACIFKQ